MFSALPPNEEARQTVIKELISTEVDYINSILSIVEVSYIPTNKQNSFKPSKRRHIVPT